ncbi:unnamed protein product [Paramecium octaurelia]|uniref:UvrD-like helicase ATP-binding domain-containing protein n=1 Tax=Paramecium octaurelia TaxID=43137 RepID=A0A8S1VN38_PAROT|nr:unnamed protein product [Paramecium octaurelia]
MRQNQKSQETQTKNYKAKVQNYLNQLKKDSRMKDMTNEKILTQIFLDALSLSNDQQYNSTIFDAIKESVWSYQIKIQILNKIINKNDKILSMVSSMLLILDGYFNFNSKKINLVYVKVPFVMKYQSFFLLQSNDNFNLLFEVGLHKKYNDTKQQICLFDIVQKITFIDIFFYQKGQEITDAIQEYQINIQKDFYRTELDQVECVSIPLTGINAKQQSYLFQAQNKSWAESSYLQQSQNLIQWIPLKFKQLKEKKEDLLLKNGHLINRSFYEKLSNLFHYENIGNQNKYKLIQFVDFESVGQILDLLQKSQLFKIKLSNQERQIVITKNNALVIGRSGTGKTTSTVLRIFATEMLVKVRSKFLGQKKIQVLQDYQGKEVEIHQLFSTANRFLVQEVEKYYNKLERQAQDAINTHRTQSTFKLDESFVSINESVISDYETDILDFVLQEEQIQQSQIGQNFQSQSKEKSLSSIKFPGFLSSEQLLILLDKKSNNPFFSIEKINKFRQKHSKKIGFQDFNGINLDEWFPQANNIQYQYQYQSQSQYQSSSDTQLKQDIIVPEVDFMVFYLQFWPQVCGRGGNNFDNTALPSLIWTQIYSYIKGSQYSYAYPNRCLPFQVYKERVSNYLSEAQMVEIYDCFLKYEIWKEKEQYIDQLDLINSLLVNIEQNQLIRFPIHYSYIDEVQDLPQAMIELFCKITEQGVIFCGDSAQCILKGVGFRFSDLQTIFKTSKKIGANQLEKFQVYQLTKNFRSHNNILQLANCIIIILELLFPNSLDHLQKEISNLKGPKPLIISQADPSLILFHLNQQCDAEEQCEIEFGYNQVIIVKNEEAKQTLPQQFKTARVLTTYQTKGLEFDDVILYNCFSSDPIPEQQWAFLSCIDVDESYVDKQVFEESITKFDEQNTKHDIELTQDGKQVVQKKLKLNQRYDKKKVNDYSSLCNELKMLYVCVTRAKKRVIIYDDDPQQRNHLERILKQYNVCDFTRNQHQNKQIPCNARQDINVPQVKVQEIQQELKQKQPRILDDEEKQIWEQQGQLMFQKRLYDEANKCFERSQNERMALLSKAYLNATKGAQKLANYKSYKVQFKIKGTLDLKNKMEELEALLKQDFQEAAQQFQQLEDFQQAANCYYSGMMYEDSAMAFLNLQILPQAAKSATKSKQFLLAILIYYQIGHHLDVLKLLSENSQINGFQYGFFKYDFLKECLTQNILQKAEIKHLLLNQLQDLNQNVFYLLAQKYNNKDQINFDVDEFTKTQISQNILDKIPIKDIFENEINLILNSQIQIDDDLEEMIYEQFKMFWEIYYEIIDSQMIINPHSKQEISAIFQSNQQIYQNRILKSFFIDVLELQNQHYVLTTLYPENRLLYQYFDQKEQIQEFKIEENNICQSLLCNERLILQFLLLDDIKTLRKIMNHQNSQQQQLYQELNDLILERKQLLNINNEELFLIKSYYILNYYSKRFYKNNNSFKNFMREFVEVQFLNRFNLFFQFQDKIHNNKELNKEDVQKLFNLGNQKEQFMILLHFFYNYQQSKFQDKFLKNFNFQQLIFLGKFLIKAVSLFKTDYEDNQYNQDVYSSICSIFGLYNSKTKFLNIFGSSITFQFKCDDSQGLSFQQNFEIEQKIEKEIKDNIDQTPILQMLFNNMIQNKAYKQQLFKNSHTLIKDLVFIFNYVCHLIKKNIIPKKKHVFYLIQAIQILDSVNIQIPQCIIEIIEKNYKFLFSLITFYTYCKNQISIKSLEHWVNFHKNRNQIKLYHPEILKNEISQVVLILILLYNVDIEYINQEDYFEEINLKYLAINYRHYENTEIVVKKEKEEQLQEIQDFQGKQEVNQNQSQQQTNSEIQNGELNQDGEKKQNSIEESIQEVTEQQNEQQQEQHNEFNKEINFIIFDEQKLLLEHFISIYYCEDDQINVDFNFQPEHLDNLLLEIYKILYNYFGNVEKKELQTFIYQHLILLNQNLLLLRSKQNHYQIIIEEIIKIENNKQECEISSESSSEDSIQGQDPEQQQKQQGQTEKNEQQDEQKQFQQTDIEIVVDSKEQSEEQSTKQQKEEEQSTIQQQQDEQSIKQQQQEEQSIKQQKEEEQSTIQQQQGEQSIKQQKEVEQSTKQQQQDEQSIIQQKEEEQSTIQQQQDEQSIKQQQQDEQSIIQQKEEEQSTIQQQQDEQSIKQQQQDEQSIIQQKEEEQSTIQQQQDEQSIKQQQQDEQSIIQQKEEEQSTIQQQQDEQSIKQQQQDEQSIIQQKEEEQSTIQQQQDEQSIKQQQQDEQSIIQQKEEEQSTIQQQQDEQSIKQQQQDEQSIIQQKEEEQSTIQQQQDEQSIKQQQQDEQSIIQQKEEEQSTIQQQQDEQSIKQQQQDEQSIIQQKEEEQSTIQQQQDEQSIKQQQQDEQSIIQQKEEEQSTIQQQQDEQSIKQQKEVEQSTKQQQQDESNQIPQSDIIIESTREQIYQEQIFVEKENQKSEIIVQNDEGQNEIKVKKQINILQNIRLQLEKQYLYSYQFDSMENLQLISQNCINCNINPNNFNQKNYFCSKQDKINQLQPNLKIDDQSPMNYINFRSKISSFPIGNKIINENLINIDKLKKILHKCITISKNSKIQGMSYSIFKEFVFLLQKVSDLEYEPENKQMQVNQQLKEIENKLKGYRTHKQKNDLMTNQLSKFLSGL